MARERGAWVVYGGIHATLFPEEALRTGRGARGGRRAMATWPGARWLQDCVNGSAERVYEGGRIDGGAVSARRAGT